MEPTQPGGKRFVYDIETDGFLESMTTIHSLVLHDLDTGEMHSYRNDGHPDNLARMVEGVAMLNAADLRVGHNIIKFDEPALKKIFPFYIPNVRGKIVDTLILSRLIFSNLFDRDVGKLKNRNLPGRLTGSHSLEAWGYRLGEWKGDYSAQRTEELKARPEYEDFPPTPEEISAHVWGQWNEEMQAYCEQDVRSNLSLYRRCQHVGYAPRAVWDEMDMAILCQKIEDNGFPFNERAAGNLYAKLAGLRTILEDKLRDTFGMWVERDGPTKAPSTSNAALGYWGTARWEDLEGNPLRPDQLTPKGMPTAFAKRAGVKRVFTGYPYSPIKVMTFSPTSRHHIANRLQALYGWKPTEYTKCGDIKIDDEIVEGLPYPCAPLLLEYFTVTKRIAQIAEGKQAWLIHVRDDRIHGSYNTVGAVTRRATHSRPNIGQVPGVQKDKAGVPLRGLEGGFGVECREMFGVPEDWYQVGTDASGLELRCLAHYMSPWDAGAYVVVLLDGDVHTVNMKAAGLTTRDQAKTFIYAFLYGAGDAKIGSIIGGTAADGKRLKAAFLAQLPALGELAKAVKKKAKKLKFLNALDGGLLHIRSDHSALNTLLQSAGALICKKWSVLLERRLLDRGYKHGWDGDFVFMAWVHDELQIAARTEELAEEIGMASRAAMKEVEAYFDFNCPLDAEFKIGKNWAECH